MQPDARPRRAEMSSHVCVVILLPGSTVALIIASNLRHG